MKIPRVLTIAGSDSSGAAGAQADLKTFAAHDVYGLSALTLVTAQNSIGIQALHALPLELIAAQIDSVMTDIGADAVKTGMLLRAETIRLVAEKAAAYAIEKLVVDPVMVAGDGRRLLDNAADRAYIEALFPRALIVTPNLDEARLLTGRPMNSPGDYQAAAQVLRAMGPRFVLIKGGHSPNGAEVVDLLYDGTEFREYRAPRIATWNARGTGCTFASAIAANVARGQSVPDAVEAAKRYVTATLQAAAGWKLGGGRATVLHGAKTARERTSD